MTNVLNSLNIFQVLDFRDLSVILMLFHIVTFTSSHLIIMKLCVSHQSIYFLGSCCREAALTEFVTCLHLHGILVKSDILNSRSGVFF